MTLCVSNLSRAVCCVQKEGLPRCSPPPMGMWLHFDGPGVLVLHQRLEFRVSSLDGNCHHPFIPQSKLCCPQRTRGSLLNYGLSWGNCWNSSYILESLPGPQTTRVQDVCKWLISKIPSLCQRVRWGLRNAHHQQPVLASTCLMECVDKHIMKLPRLHAISLQMVSVEG